MNVYNKYMNLFLFEVYPMIDNSSSFIFVNFFWFYECFGCQ